MENGDITGGLYGYKLREIVQICHSSSTKRLYLRVSEAIGIVPYSFFPFSDMLTSKLATIGGINTTHRTAQF